MDANHCDCMFLALYHNYCWMWNLIITISENENGNGYDKQNETICATPKEKSKEKLFAKPKYVVFELPVTRHWNLDVCICVLFVFTINNFDILNSHHIIIYGYNGSEHCREKSVVQGYATMVE